MSKKVLLTFADSDHQKIAALALAARLPVAVYCRSKLISGEWPAQAPPLSSELTENMRELVNMCHATRSNLTQLHTHSARIGGQLVQLTGTDGPLNQLSKQFLQLGLNVKSGHVDEAQAAANLTALSGAAKQINDLARRLNSDDKVTPADWRVPLESLSQSIEAIKVARRMAAGFLRSCR